MNRFLRIPLFVAVLLQFSSAGATDVPTGEILFAVKCGRCHNALRIASGLFRGSSARSVDELVGAPNFGHFMKGEAERRAIILYLEQITR